MYDLAVAFAGDSDSIYCLEHPIPWRSDETIWFDGPNGAGDAKQSPATAVAHIEVLTATGSNEVAVKVLVEST
ncbi:MAG: hypothetical protein IPK16_12610 [Anaerolineales bacterium]|nr:hypothetical protein [Anaerolineales bacterium]